MTSNHLNFRLGEGEARVLPLPDRVVTLGQVTLERLSRGGVSESLLTEGCALRQKPVEGTPRAGKPKAGRLLVALASSAEECAASLRLLDDAFSAGGPEIIIRPHPTISIASGLALSGPLRFKYQEDSSGTVEAAMEAADVVLYASSTLGLEAVRRGIPAVFLDVSGLLCTDPMEGFSDLKWTVRDAAELKDALAEIAALSEGEAGTRRASAAEYGERYCRPITDERLAKFLPRSVPAKV